MAEGSSCSHCWHVPFYIAMSFTLLLVSFGPIKNSRPDHPLPSYFGSALNASRALRTHGGFNIIATLLQFSPGLFFSGPETTVFAIQDSAFHSISVPQSEMRRLLQFHTTPSALPTAVLLKKPKGFCFKTLVQGKNLIITKNDAKTGSIMINNVSISHPDLFLEGPISIHGVVGPFDMTLPLVCRFFDQNAVVSNDTERSVEWSGMIKIMGLNGFVSFSIGLNAVLDGILQENRNLGPVTIFAPPNSGFISSSSPFLDRIVRLHILRQRFNYSELAKESSVETLIHDHYLKIEKPSRMMVVNGVEITRPDIFQSKNFVVHGISRAFDVDEFFSSYR